MAVQDILTSIHFSSACLWFIHTKLTSWAFISHLLSLFVKCSFQGEFTPFHASSLWLSSGLAVLLHLSSWAKSQRMQGRGLQLSSFPKAQVKLIIRQGSTHSWLLKWLIFHVLHWKSNLFSSPLRRLCMCVSRWQHCENRTSPMVHYLKYQRSQKGTNQ